MQFLEGFLFFCIWALFPGVNFHCRLLYKKLSLLEGIFYFDLYLRGYLDFFHYKWPLLEPIFEECSGRFSPGGVGIYYIETTMKD